MPINSESVVKGRIAETLVNELLRKGRNKVYRFGYETVLQNLTQLEQTFQRDTKTAEIIRSIPDLVVVNKEGETFFVEVKERTKKVSRYFRGKQEWYFFGKQEWDRLKSVIEHWNAVLILVTIEKPYFRIYDASFKNAFVPIEKYKKFNIKEGFLKEFNVLIEKYYPQSK